VVVGLGLLSWLTFTPWMAWRTTHYVFTTHRVLIRRGVLRHDGRDISLQRINDVGFSQSLWDRIVKAGTLTIESAGEQGQESLRYIPRSDAMQQLLNRLIEQDGERRARLAAGLRNTRLVGLDMHIGSQLFRLDPYLDGIERLTSILDQLRRDAVRNGGGAEETGSAAGVEKPFPSEILSGQDIIEDQPQTLGDLVWVHSRIEL